MAPSNFSTRIRHGRKCASTDMSPTWPIRMAIPNNHRHQVLSGRRDESELHKRKDFASSKPDLVYQPTTGGPHHQNGGDDGDISNRTPIVRNSNGDGGGDGDGGDILS